MIFSQTKKNAATSIATICDGALILTLTDAREPCVWRMDLSQARLSALEVKHETGGASTLQMRTPKGETHVVATYTDPARAVEILSVVAGALSGNSATSAQDISNQPAQADKNWIWLVVALVAIMAILIYMMSGSGISSSVSRTGQTGTGEALSAEEFLSR